MGTVALLVLGYAQLTALDHLHLHVELGFEFVHDHLHAGQHHHLHHRLHERLDGGEDEPGNSNGQGSTVVTFTQSAQVRPPEVETAVLATSVDGSLRLESGEIPSYADTSPPWKSRAPPF